MKKFYVTTPIYYPSDYLHIGHTYCTVAADSIKRYKEYLGYDVFFTTGSDDHGQKIMEKALSAGVTPKEYVDKIVVETKKLWEKLDIRYDKFIRTTDTEHEKVVSDIFQKLYDKGEIYKSEYKGHYCTPCEAFWSQVQLVNGDCCPDCGRPTHIASEESYFFRLSKYRDAILKLYEENPEFITPESRKNEMINNFLKDGLEDLSVTRSSFDWGVKVPFDDKHIIYVWIDALSCYITSLGYGSDDDSNFEKYWPADVHLVGKEIVRFHTIIWPALLMALDIPLPKKVFGHGWILFDNDKMSKSKGNVVYPEPIIDLYGNDAFRYFLLREFSFGSDGSFQKEKFLKRLNADLANDLGNLLSRTVSMIEKYQGGEITESSFKNEFDAEIEKMASELPSKFETLMDEYNFSSALEEVWKLIRRANKYVDETAPWILEKEGKKEELSDVLYHLAESLRVAANIIAPIMPQTAKEILRQLGLDCIPSWDSAKRWGLVSESSGVRKGNPIFPRLDIETELEKWNAANEKLIAERGSAISENEEVKYEPVKPEIGIDDFEKLDLRTGTVINVENHPKADKLYVLKVDLGFEERTVVSGLKNFYKPEEILGKQVIVLVNLKPVKLRGIESFGMLLAAEDSDGKLSLATVADKLKNGAVLA